MKVAFIGLGAIGQAVLRCLDGADVEVTGALVTNQQRPRACNAFASPDALVASRPDLVVECARQHVLAELGPTILRGGIDLLASSVGALASPETEQALESAAKAGSARLYLPAGALAGIDALAAARRIGIDSVRYTRRAPPATWIKSGALNEIAAREKSAKVIFEGSAREAAHRYPKNANVAATIALAGIGFEKTRVALVADPDATSNVHVIEAEGSFGRMRTEISATPLAGSTSSAIVAGSLARAVLSRVERIAV